VRIGSRLDCLSGIMRGLTHARPCMHPRMDAAPAERALEFVAAQLAEHVGLHASEDLASPYFGGWEALACGCNQVVEGLEGSGDMAARSR